MNHNDRLEIVNKSFDDCKKIVDLHIDMKSKKGFLKVVHTKERKGQSWYGGTNNSSRKPRISFTTDDFHFDKNFYINMLSQIKGKQQKTWAKAIGSALKEKWMFTEYSRFCEHPIIGNFISNDIVDHINSVVAHEMSHCIVCWNYRKGLYKNIRVKSHGAQFRQIYKILRREWVNKSQTIEVC
jgi:hypothetical protein